MMTTVERDFHMATGDGENSYAANSSFQRKTAMETWPELHKAVREALKLPSPGKTGMTATMVAADLACSSGPNSLLAVSEVMNTIRAHVQETRTADDTDDSSSRAIMEVQFFLNDLPGNDFNLVFRSLDEQRLQGHGPAAVDEKQSAVPCYIAGLPGSMYTRLFPCQSVHLFHSAHGMVWHSKIPDDLANGTYVENKKLSSFNIPYYPPSLDEVTQLIKQNDLFKIEDVRLFESNLDANDDSDGDVVLNCSSSAENIVKMVRAILEPLIMKHFGEDIIEELFVVYASLLEKNLEKGKFMCPVIVVMLKKSEL